MFEEMTLYNRLGQWVELRVLVKEDKTVCAPRICVFVYAPKQALSSVVAKNAEYFAAQLLDYFKLQPNRFDLIEMRRRGSGLDWLRWRFRWVGLTAVDGRVRPVRSVAQQASLECLAGLEPGRAPGPGPVRAIA